MTRQWLRTALTRSAVAWSDGPLSGITLMMAVSPAWLRVGGAT